MKLSVIICVWNQEDLIKRALDSIPKREDIEIIVVDDGSTDNTLKNLKAYPNITVISLPENNGIGHARNIGLENAHGEYVHFLDSDDYLYTDEYLKVLDLLDADIVYINLKKNDGTVLYLTKATQGLWCGMIARFIRKEFLKGHRFREVRFAEDYFLNNELQEIPHTDRFTNITAYHYNHPRKGSLCNTQGRNE